MQLAIEENLKLNKFSGKGNFIRSDVFKFLDSAYAENKKYDVIVSDPPAFTKSEKNKTTALHGYEKLHLKAMKLLNDKDFWLLPLAHIMRVMRSWTKQFRMQHFVTAKKFNYSIWASRGLTIRWLDLKIKVFTLNI